METGISLRWFLPAAATAAAFVFFLAVRGYPWHLALVMAAAIGALAYVTRATLEGIRKTHSGPGELRPRNLGKSSDG